MPWNNQGGGNGGPGPWGQGPAGGGSQPPNFEEMLRRGQDQFKRMVPGGFGSNRILPLGILVIVLLWAATGIYRVLPDEQGVVLRFGAYHDITEPGLHYHLPYPIEEVLTPNVTVQNNTTIGTGLDEGARSSGRAQQPEEALMLTGDENIVDINLSVFWKIKDAKQYLFNIRDPDGTVQAAAAAAVREVVARTPIASALAEGRGVIEADTLKLLQTILDSYAAGIQVNRVLLAKVDPPGPVIDAFRDVQRARTDQERARNEAEAYRNDIIPRARGDAERLTQEAEAYKQEIVARAEGDAQRFVSVYNAYKVSKDVTTQRLYLETMEQVLKSANKVLIDSNAQGKNPGVLPYLPLPAVVRREPPPPAASNPSSGSQPAQKARP